MSRRLLFSTVVMALFAILVTPLSTAQTLYGVDGPGFSVWEFEATAPGPPCGQPNPYLVPPFPYFFPPPCPLGGPIVGPFPGPLVSVVGDIAVDTLTDTVFVTDGLVIGEYVGDTACGAAPLSGTIIFWSRGS